jgi:hypothetical protein
MGAVWYLFGLTNGMSMGSLANEPQATMSTQEWIIAAAILIVGVGGSTYLFVRHELAADKDMKKSVDDLEQKYQPKPPTTH